MTMRKIWGAVGALLVCAGQARADLVVEPVHGVGASPVTYIIGAVVATSLVAGGVILVYRLRRKPAE
jgi:hypothetical protein